jgi:hypothetical protein
MNLSRLRPFLLPALLVAALPHAGCGKPNRANIQLRKDASDLRGEITQLRRQHEGDAARIRSLEASTGTLQTLPQERLAELFTTHGLQLGTIAGIDLDRDQAGDEGLRIKATPTDETGQKFKAAGTFVIEAFDLADAGETRLGRWEFDAKQARENWNGTLMQYAYSLTCPWQRPPTRAEVTVKVTFTDLLTGRTFTQQKVAKLDPPSAGAPATPDPPAAQ